VVLSVFLVGRLIFAVAVGSAYGTLVYWTLVQYVRAAERTAEEKAEHGLARGLGLSEKDYVSGPDLQPHCDVARRAFGFDVIRWLSLI